MTKGVLCLFICWWAFLDEDKKIFCQLLGKLVLPENASQETLYSVHILCSYLNEVSHFPHKTLFILTPSSNVLSTIPLRRKLFPGLWPDSRRFILVKWMNLMSTNASERKSTTNYTSSWVFQSLGRAWRRPRHQNHHVLNQHHEKIQPVMRRKANLRKTNRKENTPGLIFGALLYTWLCTNLRTAHRLTRRMTSVRLSLKIRITPWYSRTVTMRQYIWWYWHEMIALIISAIQEGRW